MSCIILVFFFFFKQKTAYEMRISDWSSDVCSSDLVVAGINPGANTGRAIYHSGTVGAAITARNGGLNAIAVSQSVIGFGVEGQEIGRASCRERVCQYV